MIGFDTLSNINKRKKTLCNFTFQRIYFNPTLVVLVINKTHAIILVTENYKVSIMDIRDLLRISFIYSYTTYIENNCVY